MKRPSRQVPPTFPLILLFVIVQVSVTYPTWRLVEVSKMFLQNNRIVTPTEQRQGRGQAGRQKHRESWNLRRLGPNEWSNS